MTSNNTLPKPSEMLSPAFRWQLRVLPMYVLAFFNLAFLIRLIERKGFRQTDANLLAMSILTFIFTGGIFLAMRSIEYAGPFLAMTFLLLIANLAKEDLLPRKIAGEKLCMLLLFVLSLGFALYCTPLVYRSGLRSEVRPIPNLAAWLRENVKSGEQIVNIDWSDFPQLFYYDDLHYYQWGLDPVFAMRWTPQKTSLLIAARPDSLERIPGGVKTIGRELGAGYAVLLWPRQQQAYYLMNRLG